MINRNTNETLLKNLTFSQFISGCFKGVQESFWAVLGLSLLAMLTMIAISAISMLTIKNYYLITGAILFISYLFLMAQIILIGTRAESMEMGVFSAINQAFLPAIKFIIPALLMSAPITIISLILYLTNTDIGQYLKVIQILLCIPLSFFIFTIFAMGLREKGPIDGMLYSFYLIKGNWWKTFLYLAVPVIFILVLLFLIYFLIFLLSLSTVFISSVMEFSMGGYTIIFWGLVLVFTIIPLVFFLFFFVFFYKALALLFLHLERKVMGANVSEENMQEFADFNPKEFKPVTINQELGAEDLYKTDPGVPTTEKEFRNMLNNVKTDPDKSSEEMPTILISQEKDIGKKENEQLEDIFNDDNPNDTFESTVTVSQAITDMNLSFEHADPLPDIKDAPKQEAAPQQQMPLPPPTPVANKLTIPSKPPMPPSTKKEN